MIKFTTGGFRGIVGVDFIPENIVKIASGIVKYIRFKQYKMEVALSYDHRLESDTTALLMAKTLSAAGIKVYLSQEATPSPVAMYMSKYLKIQVGIMITASHNPYDYNGVKLFENGQDASQETTDLLEIFVNQKDSLINQNDNEIVIIDFLTPYFEFVKKFINIKKDSNIKVLVDFIHGTGLKTIPYFAKYFNLNGIDFIRDNKDSYFNFTLPNPIESVLAVNREIQKEKKYQLIIGMDSDADRLGIIDENGDYVDNNEILAVIYYYLVVFKNQKGDIVKNIATSNLIDALAKKLGYIAHTVDVGFKNISKSIIDNNALIGGESSGGLTIRNFIMGKDSTLSTLLILEILTQIEKPFSMIVKEVREFTNYFNKTIEGELRFKNKENIIEKAKNLKIDDIEIKEVIEFNANIKYIIDENEWILLRFSGTEPLLRLFVETDSLEKSKNIMTSVKSLLEGL